MKYSFITQQKNTYSISRQCQVLGVNRSGYYHYQAHVANKPIDAVHQKMVDWVKAIAEHSRYSDGSRRMMKALTLRGYPVNRAKARKLMHEAGVQVRLRKKFKVTTNSHHPQPVFDHLVQRQFAVPRPDQVYASDVTYFLDPGRVVLSSGGDGFMFQENRGVEYELTNEAPTGV